MKTFSQTVRDIVPTIPAGRACTYGRVASLACSPLAARSVANAMGIPESTRGWHRVVTSRGEVSSEMPANHREKQRALLEAEGFEFDGFRIVGFAACRWHGP